MTNGTETALLCVRVVKAASSFSNEHRQTRKSCLALLVIAVSFVSYEPLNTTLMTFVPTMACCCLPFKALKIWFPNQPITNILPIWLMWNDVLHFQLSGPAEIIVCIKFLDSKSNVEEKTQVLGVPLLLYTDGF